MAETSTSTNKTIINNNNNGTSIIHMNQDQLLSILLLLPIDSLVSFALTCKRFRSLTCSDTLWESICRRDWGSSSVDAIKISIEAKHHHHHQQQLPPWMKLYKQVSQLDSVSCHRLSDPDGELLFPGPRASHSLNFVSDCLVLFGGGCEGGRHLDDTWVAYIGNDFQRTLRWQKVSSAIPSGRFGHTCVVVGDSLILFGGINDHGDRQNDTWVGNIAWHETLGVTFSWRLLDVGPIQPPPRGAHAACCIGNKMVIHGGIGLLGVRLGDTWVLDLSENLCIGTWCEIVTHPSPPARSGHTLTCIGGTQTILFGGRGLGYEVLGDVWLFNMAEKYVNWVQILYDIRNIPEGVSLPRVGHSATLILGRQVLIYGGEDSYRHRKDDFWVLNVDAIKSFKMQSAAFYSKGLFARMWKRLRSNGYVPKSRSFHRACADRSGCYLYVSGGMADGLLQPGESYGLRFDSDLFLVELLLQL